MDILDLECLVRQYKYSLKLVLLHATELGEWIIGVELCSSLNPSFRL